MYESVATGLLDGKLRFFAKRGQKALIYDSLEKMGIANLAHQSLAKLSSGQLRRTMISKAIVSNPDLILLDEPTAGLDHDSQTLLHDLLSDLKKVSTTIILVTHDLGALSVLVDKVVVLDRKARNNISYLGKLPIPVAVAPESHHSQDLTAVLNESVLGLNS